MSPLIKIPFVLVITYSVAATLTNPNPAITDRERRPNASKASFYLYITIKYIAHIR
ncbi:hypothetical protein H0H87_004597, partial [Tephrocybe sp. NHM501043]